LSRPARSTLAATAVQYSHHVVTQGSPYGSRRAQGRMPISCIQETWRLVPAAEKSGPLQRRRFPWRPTEHIRAEPREKACGLCNRPRECLFAFARGAVAAAILMTALNNERSGLLLACLAIRDNLSIRCVALICRIAWANNPHSLEITSGVAQSQVVGRTTAGDLSPY